MAIFHAPHILVFTFGVLGNIVSFFVYLAPLPTFYRIWEKKSTEGFHALPYLVALFSATLWLNYAFLKTNALLLITINSFGCAIEFLYFIVFVAFATKTARKLTIKIFALMNMGLFALILLTIHFIPNPLNRVQVMGWICVTVSVSVFAAPLSILAQVIRTRSVEFMPFTLSFFLTLSAIIWFVYGLFLNDICVAIPNVIGFILGLLQMLLYAVFRGRKEEGKLPEQVKSTAAAMGSSAAAEVHPVNAIDANGHDAHKAMAVNKPQETTLGCDKSNECAV